MLSQLGVLRRTGKVLLAILVFLFGGFLHNARRCSRGTNWLVPANTAPGQLVTATQLVGTPGTVNGGGRYRRHENRPGHGKRDADDPALRAVRNPQSSPQHEGHMV